jgi:transposase
MPAGGVARGVDGGVVGRAVGGVGAAGRGSGPKGKVPPRNLRRTIEAIVWRHKNGATWRAVPAELGAWWTAAQLFIRWAKLGVWQRLLKAAQTQAIQLGMALLDGTSIRAHHKAAGAPKKGELRDSETAVRLLAEAGEAMAPRPAS